MSLFKPTYYQKDRTLIHWTHLISRITRIITHWQRPSWLIKFMIRAYIRYFNISIDGLTQPLSHYHSLNAFFTRHLQPQYRPISKKESIIASPVDGVIQSIGQLQDGQLLQAKGHYYELSALIPGIDLTRFSDGAYITCYLSPADCHHIFSPMTGTITQLTHIPGHLYPVRPPYTTHMTGLFSRNERVISTLSTPQGTCHIVKVGALNVGTISVTYMDNIPHNHQKITQHRLPTPAPIQKGQHLGTFHMGSTVILIFESQLAQLHPLKLAEPLQYGQAIGQLTSS
ncbi:MAG: phosphatidylserine decarboxylase [Actinobacteria bacterium]|nr:phosphatidylserine decarboxylase [Actinomycetota bacterium]